MQGIAFIGRVLLVLLMATAIRANAAEIDVQDANLRATDEGLVLNAEFRFDFPAALAEAVVSGVPLYFVFEFDSGPIRRKNWYPSGVFTSKGGAPPGRRTRRRLASPPSACATA